MKPTMFALPIALVLAVPLARAEEPVVVASATLSVTSELSITTEFADASELPLPPDPILEVELKPHAPVHAPPAPEPAKVEVSVTPPAPEPVPPAPAQLEVLVRVTEAAPVEPPLPTSLLHVALTPGTTWTFLDDVGDAPHAAFLSVNVVGKVEELRGLEGGLLSNWVVRDMTGAQASTLVNWVGGDVRGLQLSLVNVGEGDVTGAQFGYANVGGGVLTGAQFGSIFNVAAGSVPGLELHRGLQFATVSNTVNGDLDGGQGSYGVNVVTGHLRGAQVGLLNIGGDVDGAQIGLVNIAGLVRGTQIGLLNISRDVHGVPVGLLNFASDGRFNAQVFRSDFAPLNVSVKVGTSQLYSLVVASFCCTKETIGEELRDGFNAGHERWSTAIGAGYHLPVGDSLWADFDVTGRVRRHTAPNGKARGTDLLVTPRAQLGWNLFGRVSAFAGLGLNVAVGQTGLPLAPVESDPRDLPAGEQSAVAVWPAFLAGVEI